MNFWYNIKVILCLVLDNKIDQRLTWRNASKHENVNQTNSCCSGSEACDICHVSINPNKKAIEASKDAEDAIDKEVVGRPVDKIDIEEPADIGEDIT